MRNRLVLLVLLAVLGSSCLVRPAMAQFDTWIEPNLDDQLKRILGNNPPMWLVYGTWQGGSSGLKIDTGAKVICVGSTDVILTGNKQWKGSYDPSTGKLEVKRTFAAAEITALEDKQNAPEWARKAVAGQAISESMSLLVAYQGDGSLTLSGKIYGEKVDWDEQVDETTNQPVEGTQKARVIADADATRDISSYTKPGLSQAAKDRLKQALHLSNLFSHRQEMNRDYQKQIQQLERRYEALRNSPGPQEQQRLDEISRSLDSLRKAWQQDLSANTKEILDSAVAHSNDFNTGFQEILDKYTSTKQLMAQDPSDTLYPGVLSDTEARLLLYLEQGADAVNNHDYMEQLSFMFSMVKNIADTGAGTGVAATSMALSNACPEPNIPSRSQASSSKNLMDTDLDAELVAARQKSGIPKATNGKVTGGTIAVSKSNVPGISDKVYEGKSGGLYREMGDEWPWNDPGDYESTNPVGQRHAEADITNQWERDLQAAHPDDMGYNVEGDIELHIEQPMCSSCAAGLKEGDVFPGSIGQFSQNHPDIDIHITNAADPNGTVYVVRAGAVVAKSFPVPGP